MSFLALIFQLSTAHTYVNYINKFIQGQPLYRADGLMSAVFKYSSDYLGHAEHFVTRFFIALYNLTQ